MSTHARDALRLLVAAMETHLEAVASRRTPVDAAVDDAYDAIAEAFEAYEEALDIEFAEALPLIVEDDEYGDDDDGDDEDSDDVDNEPSESAGREAVAGGADQIDPHAEEDEDDMDDDIEEFDLR
jgi:hypothetical protein